MKPSSPYEQIASRAESFWSQEVTCLYQAAAGLSATLDLAQVYDQHRDLFSRETVQALIAAAPKQPPSALLAEFAALRYLQQQVAALDDEIFGQMAEATITWDDKQVPFLAGNNLASHEPDPQRQLTLYKRRTAVVAAGNERRRERWRRLQAAAQELGFANYLELCRHLRRLDLDTLQREAEHFLASTRAIYLKQLAHWGEALLGTAAVHSAALPYLLAGHPFHAEHPVPLTAVLETTTAGLGISLAALPGLEIDLEKRPGKSPRPFCAFITVPDNIKLVALPTSTLQDYRAVLHELGHALHGSFTSPTLPFAGRYLGDDGVSESYAFLFENLAADAGWWQQQLHIQLGEAERAYGEFVRLLTMRRCAAMLLYECQLHQGVSDAASRYETILTHHLALPLSPEYYLINVDDGLYIAHYWRAFLLEAQLRSTLTRRFGAAWFTSPAAGMLLQELWANGQLVPVEQLARQYLGYAGISSSDLIAQYAPHTTASASP